MSDTLSINNISFYYTNEAREVREKTWNLQKACREYAARLGLEVWYIGYNIKKLRNKKNIISYTEGGTLGATAAAGIFAPPVAPFVALGAGTVNCCTKLFCGFGKKAKYIIELFKRIPVELIDFRKKYIKCCKELNETCIAMRDTLPNDYQDLSDVGLVSLALNTPGTQIVFRKLVTEGLKEIGMYVIQEYPETVLNLSLEALEILNNGIVDVGSGTAVEMANTAVSQFGEVIPIIGSAVGLVLSLKTRGERNNVCQDFEDALAEVQEDLDALRSQWMHFAGLTKDDCEITYGFKLTPSLKVEGFYHNKVPGIDVGDGIVEIRGKKVYNREQFDNFWTEDLEDDFVTFQIERGGKKFEVMVEVGPKPFWLP
jgi:hypothetical protein